MSPTAELLPRIAEALEAARAALAPFRSGEIASSRKSDHSPVTEADHAVDRALRSLLPRAGEGWLSEETADSPARLACESVWVVDPIDGTHEFIDGIPEWCVSVGFVHRGHAVAGGILNPATGELFLGALGAGAFYNGAPVSLTPRSSLDGAVVLASRSETRRGEWRRYQASGFTAQPVGSVAYKLALVSAGRADATWTLSPKNEWDIAAGAALVTAAGGFICHPDFSPALFNQPVTRVPGFIAAAPGLEDPIRRALARP